MENSEARVREINVNATVRGGGTKSDDRNLRILLYECYHHERHDDVEGWGDIGQQ